MTATLRTLLAGHPAELRHALRVTVAVVASYGAVKLLAMPQGYWAVITAILVVQTSIGGSLKAAFDRLLGTLAGALYGALVALAIPHATDVGLGLAIVAAILPLAYLAAVYPSFRVAPVTALIVLLPLYGHAANPLVSALERVAEIVIGSVVALAVTLGILPPRAHGLLRQAAAQVIALNADLMEALMRGLLSETGRQGVQPIHASIRAALKKTETVAEEAAREGRMRVSENRDPEPIVRTLYRLRHDLVMIGRASARPLPASVPHLRGALESVRANTTAALRALSKSWLDRLPAPSLDTFAASVKAFSTEVDNLGAALPRQDAGRMFALRFALEQLAEDLRDLAARTTEMAPKPLS